MKVVTRKVYYCEHCKRHRMTASAIAKHEPRCIYNPARTLCGWHRDESPNPAAAFVEELRRELDLDALRKFAGDCPACMLAAVVQADLHYDDRDDLGFDYKAEVERFRDGERHDEAGWL